MDNKDMRISTSVQAGVDEAGRGPLVGAVYAAAVILPDGFSHPLLNDSKKVSERNRQILRPIIEREALAWAVCAVSPERIDEINILNATFEAMNGAVEALRVKPQELLIDGNRFKSTTDIPYQTIIKGDAKESAIAAASILAKTHRDEYMEGLAKEYPQYGWDKNKGYPTPQHKALIELHGLTVYHRKTFRFKTINHD